MQIKVIYCVNAIKKVNLEQNYLLYLLKKFNEFYLFDSIQFYFCIVYKYPIRYINIILRWLKI